MRLAHEMWACTITFGSTDQHVYRRCRGFQYLRPGEAAAFAPVRVWPPAASAEKLASWGDHPETAVLRQAAKMQAAETQQAAWSLGYETASVRSLAAEDTVRIRHYTNSKGLKGIEESKAGQRSAILYSLIVSCQRHGKDPLAYLRDVLDRLPRMTNRDDLAPLLPKNWTPAAPAGVAT